MIERYGRKDLEAFNESLERDREFRKKVIEDLGSKVRVRGEMEKLVKKMEKRLKL